MHLTHDEFQYLLYRQDLSPDTLKRVLQGLSDKGIVSTPTVDARIVEGMEVILEIIKAPERSAHFELSSGPWGLKKRVFTTGTKRVLCEYLPEEIILSLYDNEADSVKQEISNYTGLSFQPALTFSAQVSKEVLVALLTLLDYCRSHLLRALASNAGSQDPSWDDQHASTQAVDFKTLRALWQSPLKSGMVAFLNPSNLGDLEFPRAEDFQPILARLIAFKLLDEAARPTPQLLEFARAFLVPLNLIQLELSQGRTYARETILQGSLRAALNLVQVESGYTLEVITGSSILERIEAYLSCPIIST